MKSNVTNANGVGIRIGQGQHDVRVTGNRALGNAALDLDDENASCGSNRWGRNTALVLGAACLAGG